MTVGASTRLRWRERWRRLHLWLGLSLGGVFVLLGLTGSVLVFYPEVDAWLNPPLAWQEADGCVTAWEPVLQALRRAQPGRERGWRIELPPQGCGMVTARYLLPVETAGQFFAPLLITLHPRTLEPVATRFWGESVVTWLFNLHYTLLAGASGRTVVGVLGLMFTVSLLSGLVLWWPTSTLQWRTAWRWKRGAGRVRRTWEQHRLAGAYGWALLMVLGITGALLALPDWVEPVVARLSPPLPMPKAQRSMVPVAGAKPLSLDAALAAAQARFPRAVARWVDTPDAPEGSYRVRMHQPGEPSQRFPKTLVWLDAYSGAVLAVHDARQASAGDIFLAWLHPLHNGEVLGLPGRLLACVGGLLLPCLWWTGLRRWADRQRGQRARHASGRTGGPAG